MRYQPNLRLAAHTLVCSGRGTRRATPDHRPPGPPRLAPRQAVRTLHGGN
jgi:hypothetical protein